MAADHPRFSFKSGGIDNMMSASTSQPGGSTTSQPKVLITGKNDVPSYGSSGTNTSANYEAIYQY